MVFVDFDLLFLLTVGYDFKGRLLLRRILLLLILGSALLRLVVSVQTLCDLAGFRLGNLCHLLYRAISNSLFHLLAIKEVFTIVHNGRSALELGHEALSLQRILYGNI